MKKGYRNRGCGKLNLDAQFWISKKGQMGLVVFAIVIVAIIVIIYFGFFDKGESNVGGVGTESEIIDKIADEVTGEDIEAENNENNVSDIVNDTIPEPDLPEGVEDLFTNVSLPHWPKMPITYILINSDECAGVPVNNLESAMGHIEAKTNESVNFARTSSLSDADITVQCIDLDKLLINNSESGYTCVNKSFDYEKFDIHPHREEIILSEDILISKVELERNSTDSKYEICYVEFSKASDEVKNALSEKDPEMSGNVILGGEMNIFVPGKTWNDCPIFPSYEAHNLLHLLGFDHSIEPEKYDIIYGWIPLDFHLLADLMFNERICKHQKRMQDAYGTCLTNIYTNQDEECSGVKFA